MSIDLQPLIWKNTEKSENDDIWPKKVYGASLLYLKDLNQYYLIGGNHNAYENERRNYDLNKEIIKSVNYVPKEDEMPEDLVTKAEVAKLKYITDNTTEGYYTNDQISLYIYQLDPEPHWYKTTPHGKCPRPRAYQKCVYVSPYIFLFGGVELGPKSEDLSNDEFYVLNTKTFEWKQIVTDTVPYNRTEFQWVRINESCAILYGGASSPSLQFYEDLWMFRYNGNELFNDAKKEVICNQLWYEMPQKNSGPGKLKAYSMEHYHSSLYIFGGIDNKRKVNNNLYKYDISTNTWSLVPTKGQQPCPRAYHEMSLINHETFAVFGGIEGPLAETENMLNDLYLFNIRDSIWVNPKIGGIQPSPRVGFSLCCNYGHSRKHGHPPYEIMLLGGYMKEGENSEKSRSYVRIFVLTENDPLSDFFWTIKDSKYKEEENDDNFLFQAEQSIYQYKEKISNLELDTRSKEIQNEEIKKQINQYKKQFFQLHGFIDDQSQSLEDQIKEQENQKVKMKENLDIDRKITDLKIKLKYVMERKTEKTMDFFNETCGIFMNYYDALGKIVESDKDQEFQENFPIANLEEIKKKYKDKLMILKKNLEKFNENEEEIIGKFQKFKLYEKSLDDAFKNEIEKYKLDESK